MSDCIFCKIVAGSIPSQRVYEDEHAIAFLDINPASAGHTLVIPREHGADLLELSDAALAGVAVASKRVAQQLMTALEIDGINVLQNNGPAAGQVVFHYHVHLIPRREGDGVVRAPKHHEADKQQLAQLAERIRAAGSATS